MAAYYLTCKNFPEYPVTVTLYGISDNSSDTFTIEDDSKTYIGDYDYTMVRYTIEGYEESEYDDSNSDNHDLVFTYIVDQSVEFNLSIEDNILYITNTSSETCSYEILFNDVIQQNLDISSGETDSYDLSKIDEVVLGNTYEIVVNCYVLSTSTTTSDSITWTFVEIEDSNDNSDNTEDSETVTTYGWVNHVPYIYKNGKWVKYRITCVNTGSSWFVHNWKIYTENTQYTAKLGFGVLGKMLLGKGE